MNKIFCLVQLSIFVYGSDILQNINHENVNNLKSELSRNESVFFSIPLLKNIAQEQTTSYWQKWESLIVYFLKKTSKTVIDSAFNSARTDVPNSNFVMQFISFKDRKLNSTLQNIHVTLDDKLETDDIYLFFDEKERRDGFKRTLPKDNPYAVLIYIRGKYEPEKIGLCSGCLITTRCVLTAAHCFDRQVDRVLVYAGGNSFTELITGHAARHSQLRMANSYYKHPRYSKEGQIKSDDVAVIVVRKAFKMTRTVKTIKLLRRPWAYEEYKACMMTGFGRVHYLQVDPEDNTRKTHYLEVKSGCPCFPHFDEILICSSLREDYGVCSGDSGSGLICNGTIVAIAWSILMATDIQRCDLELPQHPDCGLKNTLSIFLKVYPFLDFVDSAVQKASTDRSCHLNVNSVIIVIFIVLQNALLVQY